MNEPAGRSATTESGGRGWKLSRIVARLTCSIVAFLVMLEIALRAIGFADPHYVARVRDNRSGEIVAEFKRDDRSLWAPEPGTGPFNSGGFIGPELSRERTPGTIRIACLGDSCTQNGSPAYPARLARQLADQGYTNVEVMNWGVAGFSSFQGLARLRYDVLPYRPDIYTIYFGWNDHWIQDGRLDDSSKPVGHYGPIWQVVDRARVTQAAGMVWEALLRRGAPMQFRVPLPHYRENLREMIRLAREHGGKPLLITPPNCLGDDRPLKRLLLGLESTGYRNATELHADYVAATRQVGRDTGADILDLDRYFAESISGCDYFLPDKDPVHLIDEGLEIVAERIAERLVKNGWLENKEVQ